MEHIFYKYIYSVIITLSDWLGLVWWPISFTMLIFEQENFQNLGNKYLAIHSSGSHVVQLHAC